MRWWKRRVCICGHPRDLHGYMTGWTCCDVASPLCTCLVFRWRIRCLPRRHGGHDEDEEW